jgi:hemerythrin-like domain-containing protein
VIINELGSVASQNRTDKLFLLADSVDEHVRYEERILFPYLEKELSGEQLEDIGKRIPGAPLKDNYEDAFWIKSKSL